MTGSAPEHWRSDGASADAQTFATAKPSFETQQGDLGSSRQAFSQATFATLSFRLGSRLVVAPGLRGDLFAEENTEAFFFEPRLDILYRLTETIPAGVNLYSAKVTDPLSPKLNYSTTPAAVSANGRSQDAAFPDSR